MTDYSSLPDYQNDRAEHAYAGIEQRERDRENADHYALPLPDWWPTQEQIRAKEERAAKEAQERHRAWLSRWRAANAHREAQETWAKWCMWMDAAQTCIYGPMHYDVELRGQE
ncbi:MAG TPA: hypothetical protein PLE61_15980 [Vicinamibacterales bacterium]|nr:hypothetical protein [Vicinamibacterales bacterium]